MQRREFLGQATAASLALAADTSGTEAAAEPSPAPLFTTDPGRLEQTVQSTVDSKRLGQIVFVRYLLETPGGEEREILARLGHMAKVVRGWLGQPIRRLQAVGSLESGQVSVTLQGAGGASALVSNATGRGDGDGVSLLLLGNHGSASYSSATAPQGMGQAKYTQMAPSAPLEEAIRKALKTGQPQDLNDR